VLSCEQFVYSETNEERVHVINIKEIKYLELQKKWLIFTLFLTLEIHFFRENLIKSSIYISLPFLVTLQIRSINNIVSTCNELHFELASIVVNITVGSTVILIQE
jgi:hypothetical protein